jgi:hypothetical protein
MADVDVGRGRVQPQLDAQRLARGLGARELLHPGVLRQQLLGTAQGDFERVPHGIGHGVFCNGGRIHRVFRDAGATGVAILRPTLGGGAGF